MRHCIFVLGKIFLILFYALSSCSDRLSEISISSNLQEGDSISVAFHFFSEQWNDIYIGAAVTSADALHGRVDVPFADSIVFKAKAMSVVIHFCSDSVLTISSIRLKNYSKYGIYR